MCQAESSEPETSCCRNWQRHKLLPLVHDAQHEEEDLHLLLPLVQVQLNLRDYQNWPLVNPRKDGVVNYSFIFQHGVDLLRPDPQLEHPEH